MQKDTVKTVRLELDAAMLTRLEKLCDFHGEALDETIRICILHEWSSYRMEYAGTRNRRNRQGMI